MAGWELRRRLAKFGFVHCVFESAALDPLLADTLPLVIERQFIALAYQGFQRWFGELHGATIVGYVHSGDLEWDELLGGLAPAHVIQDLETQDLVAKAPAGRESALCWRRGVVGLNRFCVTEEIASQSPEGAPAPAADMVAPIDWLMFLDEDVSRGSQLHARIDTLITPENQLPKCGADEASLRGTLVELTARGEFLDTVISRAPERLGDPLRGIDLVLPDYGMKVSDAEAVLNLLPDARRKLATQPSAERFRVIWSILGNDNVAAGLADLNSLHSLAALARSGVVTQFNQLTYLTPKAISFLSSNGALKIPLANLRTWLSAQPTKFATFLETLADRSEVWENTNSLNSAFSAGLVTPNLFEAALRKDSREVLGGLNAFRASIAPTLLANHPVNNEVVEQVSRHWPHTQDVVSRYGVVWETAYSLFAPVTLAYSGMLALIDRLGDRTDDFSQNAIAFGGRHWDSGLSGYSFQGVTVFPSKNRLSIVAKASAGLCTSRDAELYNRSDHLQLTVYDVTQAAVVGSVQLYCTRMRSEPAILIRGINPTQRYDASKVKVFVDLVVCVVSELAQASGIPHVILSEGLGVWSADSSHSSVRGYLDKVRSELPAVGLDLPIHLFTFRGRRIVASSGVLLPT
ncbi:hypothetical protein NKJ86_10825 [Mesorhizobium sp. M0025]|uniref:hypothetical protein n=1 Tax=Mesorhizobium sp. M0025 TaxID=2956846 RepID=UPI00333682D5